MKPRRVPALVVAALLALPGEWALAQNQNPAPRQAATPANAQAPGGTDATQPGAPAQPAGAVDFERLPNGDVRLGGITLHRQAGEISFPATVCLGGGVLEVIVSLPDGRLHESLLRTEVKALHLQTLLFLLDLKNGPRLPDQNGHQGDVVDIDLEWQHKDGRPVREPVEEWILDTRTGKPMSRCGWAFVGASMADGLFQADAAGNLIINYSVADTVLDIADPSGEDDTVYEVNDQKADPGKDAPVRVIVVPRKKKQP